MPSKKRTKSNVETTVAKRTKSAPENPFLNEILGAKFAEEIEFVLLIYSNYSFEKDDT